VDNSALFGTKLAILFVLNRLHGGMNRMPEGRMSILIVDDDIDFCAIMREILREEGYEVFLAFDVPHALSLLRRIKPSLILSDVMMPDVDGLDLIRHLRSEPDWANIPTIVISARAMPDERQAAKEAGADAFVPKPFSIKDLRLMINSFLPCGVS
jgi:CheY-like chemotaxis protein